MVTSLSVSTGDIRLVHAAGDRLYGQPHWHVCCCPPGGRNGGPHAAGPSLPQLERRPAHHYLHCHQGRDDEMHIITIRVVCVPLPPAIAQQNSAETCRGSVYSLGYMLTCVCVCLCTRTIVESTRIALKHRVLLIRHESVNLTIVVIVHSCSFSCHSTTELMTRLLEVNVVSLLFVCEFTLLH